jgi:hypothetical protein
MGPDQRAIMPVPVVDGLLAATALINGLTPVTRNDRAVTGLDAQVFNPFSAPKTTIGCSFDGMLACLHGKVIWRAVTDDDEHNICVTAR